ncbi:hypothetical protein PIB30_069613 [Stylosanthes scabra]|uniref:Transposase MuDR plant domain-containing protein n=1 Tax=Stylosanthes scabra TaxID=79078 RepID=A0ABU6RNG7_9FABA|nr:hypothetical protein [Stylosanthes scabra]
MLVWLLNDEHVQVTFECHRRLMAETIMEFLVVADETGSPSVPQSSESPGTPIDVTPLCIAGPVGDGVEVELGSFDSDSDYLGESDSSSEGPNGDEYIRRRQLMYVLGRVRDPLQAGLADYYNTDGGVEFRVGHRMRRREVFHMAVKNYSIRRNVEYRVVESDRIKYHCRCKHAVDGCPWSIRVALRQNLGYWEVRKFGSSHTCLTPFDYHAQLDSTNADSRGALYTIDCISNGPPNPASLMNGISTSGGAMLSLTPRRTSIQGV